MHNAIIRFRDNVTRIREIGGLHGALSSLTTSIVDVSDLLRTQIVMTVSALDHYIHEITRLGMLEIFNGNRASTDGFLRFQISLNVLQNILSSRGVDSSWFENEIREKHSYLAFQHPDRIADAIRLIYPNPIWPEIASQLALPVADIKTELKLIVERRNKIAHEADMDPSFPGVRWPITQLDAANTVSFIETLCEAIHVTVI